jgi:prepilin-type N-terminal cleavage/methylation domain-containing protein
MSVIALVNRVRARMRCERGFTLIEMLVAASIGVVVLLVLLNLVDATQKATGRVTNRVDGTQRGRVALEQMTQRLRSQVCLPMPGTTPPVPPIVDGQTTSVTFYASLGSTTAFQPQKRKLYVSGGDLHEQVTQGVLSSGSWTFTGTAKDRILLKAIEQAKAGPNDTGYTAGTNLPYFRYYAYDALTPASASVEVKPPFTTADPARIVRVVISFKSALAEDDRVDTAFVDGVTSRLANPGAVPNPSDPNDPPLNVKRGPRCTL